MNKSFQESNGTVLSTDWKSIGSKKTEYNGNDDWLHVCYVVCHFQSNSLIRSSVRVVQSGTHVDVNHVCAFAAFSARQEERRLCAITTAYVSLVAWLQCSSSRHWCKWEYIGWHKRWVIGCVTWLSAPSFSACLVLNNLCIFPRSAPFDKLIWVYVCIDLRQLSTIEIRFCLSRLDL